MENEDRKIMQTSEFKSCIHSEGREEEGGEKEGEREREGRKKGERKNTIE